MGHRCRFLITGDHVGLGENDCKDPIEFLDIFQFPPHDSTDAYEGANQVGKIGLKTLPSKVIAMSSTTIAMALGSRLNQIENELQLIFSQGTW